MIAAESQGFSKDDANVERLCRLGGLSRASYYRHFGPHPPKRDDADLRDLIHGIALANRHYGYRRIAHELRRQGLTVNDKRVRRLSREDNLLSQRARLFVPATSMSRHDFPVVPNLTRPCSHRGRSDLGRRHHLRAAGGGLRLSGSGPRCLLAQGGRLGGRRHPRGFPGDRGSRHGARRPQPAAHEPHPPLRQSEDNSQFPGGLTQIPIDRLVGWHRRASRCGLTRIPIGQPVSFPGPVGRPGTPCGGACLADACDPRRA